MADIKELLHLYEKLLDNLGNTEKDLLLELASNINAIKEDFANQSEVLKEHFLKLQLYGYKTATLQTIYDIYQHLFNWTEKPTGVVFNKPGRAYEYLLPFSENAFNRFSRLSLDKIKNKWIKISQIGSEYIVY